MENFEDEKSIKGRQLQNLENLVENHTRTQRHLEQYSNIGDEGNKQNAREKQEIREEQIEQLEQKIIGNNTTTPQEQLQNVKDNYIGIQNYIQNNKDSIDQTMLKNLEERQQNRKMQIEQLQQNTIRKQD